MDSGLAYVLTKMPPTHAIARPAGTCNRKKRHSTLPTFAANPRNALRTQAACQTSVSLHAKTGVFWWLNRRGLGILVPPHTAVRRLVNPEHLFRFLINLYP